MSTAKFDAAYPMLQQDGQQALTGSEEPQYFLSGAVSSEDFRPLM
jgi:hypothetical protein